MMQAQHPEDIKAAIRKRYGSLAAFERTHGLARQSVTEVLRGRPSARTQTAIENVLREGGQAESITPVDNQAATRAHRLNAGGR